MEPNDLKTTAGASTLNPDQLQSDMDTIKNVLSETDKNRDIHRIIIAAGNLVEGVLTLIAVPFILLAVGIVGIATPETPPGEPSPTLIVGAAGMAVLVVISLFSIPFLLAGWGLLKRKRWGNALAVVTAALSIFNIPLGTALAIYTFWALAKGKLAHS